MADNGDRPERRAIGIEIGEHRSIIAILRDGAPELLPIGEGLRGGRLTELFQRIRRSVEGALGHPMGFVVVAVPGALDARQSRAIRRASNHAGVEIARIVSDHAAVALAHGYGRDLYQRIAVCHLGSELRVAIVDIRNDTFEVMSFVRAALGGRDFDERMLSFVLQGSKIDPTDHPELLERLMHACERAKIELSSQEDTSIELFDIYRREGDDSVDLNLPVSRADFEPLCADLIDRLLEAFDQAVIEAGAIAGDVDTVLLVGEQARMPLVQQQIAARTGVSDASIHLAWRAAIGAALVARDIQGAPSRIIDVLSTAIGLEMPNGSMRPVFAKNRSLPAEESRVLVTTRDRQRSLNFRLLQGLSERASDNTLLGAFTVGGMREGKRGEVVSEVHFCLDSDGLLSLSARDPLTGAPLSVRKAQRRAKRGERPPEAPERYALPRRIFPAKESPAIFRPRADGFSVVIQQIASWELVTVQIESPRDETYKLEAERPVYGGEALPHLTQIKHRCTTELRLVLKGSRGSEVCRLAQCIVHPGRQHRRGSPQDGSLWQSLTANVSRWLGIPVEVDLDLLADPEGNLCVRARSGHHPIELRIVRG